MKAITIILILAFSIVKAQDTTLHMDTTTRCKCKVDTLAIIAAYLKSTNYAMPYIVKANGTQARIKQKGIYAGVGGGLEFRSGYQFNSQYANANDTTQQQRTVKHPAIGYVNLGYQHNSWLVHSSIGMSLITLNLSYIIP